MMIFRVLLLCCTYVCVQAQRLGICSLTGYGHTALQGRVEVSINGLSGTICDDKFDNNAATVVCRELGYNYGGIAVLDHRFGPGTGPIWLDDVICRGDEQYLNQCMSRPLNSSNCKHKEDVGVICNTNLPPLQVLNTSITHPIIVQPSNCPNNRNNLDVRLIGPSNLIGIGYVEIKHNGVWGSICDDQWGLLDAIVICRMLCFEVYCVIAGAPVEIASGIDIVSANYLLDDVECTGNETDISQCKKREWGVHNCIPDQKEFASVTCIPLKNERPPAPVPHLGCSNGKFNVQFSRYQDRFLLTEHLSVFNKSSLCTVTKTINASTVSIIIPFTAACGTHISGNATHIFYINRVGYKYTMVQNHVIRVDTYWIDVTCEFIRTVVYSNNQLLTNNNLLLTNNQVLINNLLVPFGFTPMVEVITQKAHGNFYMSISFFNVCNISCFHELTGAVNLYVGEWINVAVSLTSIVQDDLKLVVPMCKATSTNNRRDMISAKLFENKCRVEQSLFFYSLNSTSFGFSYRAFRFDTTDSVYIHCDAFVCLKSEKHNLQDCNRNCNPTQGNRGKREASREIFHLVSRRINIRKKDKLDGKTNEQSVTLSTSTDMKSAYPFTSLLSSGKVESGTTVRTRNFKTVTSSSIMSLSNSKITVKQDVAENYISKTQGDNKLVTTSSMHAAPMRKTKPSTKGKGRILSTQRNRNFKTIPNDNSSPMLETNSKTTPKQERSEKLSVPMSTALSGLKKRKLTFKPNLKFSEHSQIDSRGTATTGSVINMNTNRTTSSAAVLFDPLNTTPSSSQTQKRHSKTKPVKFVPDPNKLYVGGLGGKLTFLSGVARLHYSSVLVFGLMMISMYVLIT